MRPALFLVLALPACSDGSEPMRPQHQLIAAVRVGLYAVKAAPGGALAQFSDVRLYGKGMVCGVVDAQDGGGPRRFAAVGGGEPVIEGSGDAAAGAKIARTCKGPARKVTSRNPGYTDIQVDDVAA
jgi:hypothetical protein